ncbi:MAG: DNA polymerase III subunit beta [Thermoanaerobacterales bacterium]|nr:DNA polymerase III subunit beta [Thermoanaerobacterales bacterium]
MNFCIDRDVLAQTISIVERFVPSKTTIPILSGIKFYTYEGELNLASTDVDMGINYTIKKNDDIYEIRQEGAVVVSARILSEIVRKMPSGPVDFSVDGNHITLSSGELKIEIYYYSAEDFPEISISGTTPCLKFSQRSFKEMIKKTIYAKSDDYTLRPQLTGALIQIADGVLNMVCLDGYRIAWCWEKVKGDSLLSDDLSVIVPGKTLMELSKIFEDDDSDFMMYIGKNKVEFTNNNLVISSRVLEGSFIDYKNVMDIDEKTKVVVDCGMLLSAIERALVLAREGSQNNLFKLKINVDEIVVSAESDIGNIQEKIKCNTKGEELLIAFNARFFIDALRAANEPRVILKFSGQSGPCIITPENSRGRIDFILPVKLRGEI